LLQQRVSEIRLRAFASRVLDRKYHYLLGSIIDGIVDEVGIASRHQLADARNTLSSAYLRKQQKMLERLQIADRTRTAAFFDECNQRCQPSLALRVA
jgi:hypothetical protein